ncbi:MAG TPA: LysR family transcriptional regulator [Rhodoferax sp.]
MQETISLDDLALFLAVAEAGNMTRVADRRGLPKSTVSRTIRRLEERMGMRLFERSTRHLRLTTEGEHLLEQTRPLVERLHETLAQTMSHGETPHGLLRVSAPYEFGLLRLGEVVTALLTQYAGLEIDIDLSSSTPDPRVENFDIVFRLQIGEMPDSDQIARRIYTFGRGLYASPTLLLRHGVPTTLAELAALPCLNSPNEPVWRLRNEEGLLHEFQPVSRLRAPNVGMRLEGVLAGLGVGMLSNNYCRDELAAGRIQPALPNFTPEPALMYALLPSRRLMPPKVRVFLDALDQRLTEPLGTPKR